MTGEAGLHGDLRGLLVTDFAEHDHVRVLAQDGAQAAGKGQPGTRVDGSLADAGDSVFHRVLDREDVAAAVVEAVEAGIQGRGLARTGRPRGQHYAVGPCQATAQALQHRRRHAQVAQRQQVGLLVEHAHHHPFAVDAGQGRDPHIHFAPRRTQGDTAILGLALFGDVQTGHDLDPRHQHGRQRTRWAQHFAQVAIDTQAHHQALLEGFYVNVRGTQAQGLAEQAVDQADYRGFVVAFQQVLDARHFAHQAVQVDLVADAFDQRLGGGIAGLVQLAEAFVEQCRLQVFEQAGLAVHAQQLLQLGAVGVVPQP